MKNKYREKFLSNLTDTVCDYLKRYANGEILTDNQLVLVHVYLRELQKEETPTLTQKIDSIVNFAKKNLSGLLAGGTVAGADDYKIKVSEDN